MRHYPESPGRTLVLGIDIAVLVGYAVIYALTVFWRKSWALVPD